MTPIDNDSFFGYPSMLILRKKELIFSLGPFFFILSRTTPVDDVTSQISFNFISLSWLFPSNHSHLCVCVCVCVCACVCNWFKSCAMMKMNCTVDRRSGCAWQRLGLCMLWIFFFAVGLLLLGSSFFLSFLFFSCTCTPLYRTWASKSQVSRE